MNTKQQVIEAQKMTLRMENSVIGAVLKNNSALDDIDLAPENFYSVNCRLIFESMLAMRRERKGIDLNTLSEYLQSKYQRDMYNEILQIWDHTVSGSHAKTYAEKVKDYWKTRRVVDIAADMMVTSADFNPALIDKAIRDLMALNTTAKNHNHHISHSLQIAQQEIEKARVSGNMIEGILTGIPELDEGLSGFHNTDLIIIAARPAMGKTALLLNVLTKHGLSRPGIASAEQNNTQIAQRLMSIHGSVNGTRMRNGQLNDSEYNALSGSIRDLNDRCIWINDKPSMTISDIERQARQWKHENGINALGVDYIQKIKHENPRMTKVDQVGDITVRLKDLAKELNIPVVALAQVSRKVDDREDKQPQAGDMKDSSVIEQEADQIITVMRPEVYEKTTDRKGVADLNICKNRHGAIFNTTVKWVAKYMQFNSMNPKSSRNSDY